MNHIYIWIHLIAFVHGTALLVFLSIIYQQKKQEHIKYIILADAFYTLLTLIDTLNLYLRKNLIKIFPDTLLIGRIYDLICLVLTAHFSLYTVPAIEAIIKKKPAKNTTLLFIAPTLLVFVIGTVLDILKLHSISTLLQAGPI